DGISQTGATAFKKLAEAGGQVTFTALWKPMGYDITYDYQGGNGNEANPASASLGEIFEVTPPTREGYDFAGWDITDMTRDASWTWWDAKGQATSGTGVRSLSKIMGVAFKNLRANGDYEVRFKANWSRYAVTYRLRGGSWPDGVSAPTAYTASSALPVPIPIRAGYLFAGWEEFGTSDAVLGNGQTGDVTLTALWLPEGIWVNAKDGGVPVVAKSKKNLGKFKVVEKTATQGYIRDKNPQYFEIDGMETEEHRVELTFVNTPNEYRVHKMDPDGLRINGAVFRFYCDDADVLAPHIIGEHTTGPYDGEDGVIVLQRIPTGTWHFKEVSAPSPYIANTTAEYTFAVNSDGEVESARKYQDVPNGSGPSVYIRKVSEEGKPLNGAWFEITRESDGYVLQKKTNSSGTILLAGLSDGSYAVKESQTRNDSLKALGFVLSDETWRIQVQGNLLTALSAGVTIETAGSAKIAVITAVNRRPRLTVLKKDKSGNPLAGARFLLTNLSTGERKSGITGSDGILIFKEAFSEGAWTAVETKAPDGPLAYRLDGHTETFTVENGLFGGMFEELQLAFVNEPYSFEIRKADTKGQPIAGARFHIWSDNGFDQEVETALAENPDQSPMFDESGLRVANALVENLPTGKFYVEEIWTPDGYRLDPQRQEVLVTSDGPSPASLAFVNEPCEVKLRKVDEEGNPLAGATFALKRPETGETVREEVTGEDGYIVLSLPGLSRGTYELWETAAPEGFELLSFGIPLSYDGKNLTVDTTGLEGALFDENSWTVTVEEPRQQAGIVRVRKTDGVTGETLRDAVFEARERIGTDSENGNLYAEAGQELVFLAEEDCFAADPPLPITKDNGGCYKIVEVRAPEGYLRDFEEEIVLEKGEKAAEVMLNAPNTPNSFEIWKEDELGNKLEEAWFKVWREGGQTEAETEALQTTGGILRLEKIASGTWHFREVPPYPAGCKGDDSLYTFIVDEDGRIAGEDHIVVINQWIASEYGGIEINKTNENGEPLEGVVFRAYPFDKEAGANGAFPEAVWLMEHKEETGFTEEETAAFLANAGAYEFAWDAEKKVYRTIQLLPLTEKNQSRYLVVEEGFESPEGYAANARADICLDPEVNPEVFAAEFPTLKLRLLKAEETFVNEPNGVRILKVDEEGDPLPGAVFRVTCDQGHEVFPETDLTTGGDGWTQKLQKLPAGKYSVKEIAAPAGYILHTELTWHFEVNTRGLLAKTLEDGSVIDQDGDGETLDEYSEELEIQAVDEENAVYVLKTDADGEPLADVEVSFWNPNGQLYAVKTTGPDGKTEPLSGLAEGVWTYKETKKNGQPYTDIERHFIVSPLGVREKYGDTPMIVMELRIRNGERTGNVTVEKVDKKTRERLHGAVFEVFPYDPEQSDYDMENPCLTLTEEIGEDGKPTGIYRNEELIVADSENGGMFLVAEMAGPLDPETGERVYAAVWEREIDLYEEPEPAFTVGSGDPAENVKTSYRIEKVDAEENLLDGAVFRIWAEEDEANAYERTTGADGETGAILLGGLDPSGTSPLLSGKTYYYKEITPPPGAYLLDGKVRSFKVAEDGTILGASSGRVKVVNRTQNTTRLSAGGDGRLPGILAACLGFSMLALSAALKAWADARDRQ
ncbi:MAG: SpaA isopeptide-forming pilin-related protein, partial [Lachnospiraceae bacterium]